MRILRNIRHGIAASCSHKPGHEPTPARRHKNHQLRGRRQNLSSDRGGSGLEAVHNASSKNTRHETADRSARHSGPQRRVRDLQLVNDLRQARQDRAEAQAIQEEDERDSASGTPRLLVGAK